ncbi:MAG: efflux RND transporter periplasmic adaptor subunit [Thermoguttaceae bacterium]|nr:efflux RND transporter periplasmic adaptor subunit [Thermoguttaceae bacterium]
MNINNCKTRRFFAAVAAVALVLPIVANVSCNRRNADSANVETVVSATVPRPVQAYVIPDGSDVETRTFPVFVKGGETAKLSFRVPGRLVEFNAEVGSRFNKGDVVAVLDPRDYQLAVDRATKAIEEAKAGLSAMETGARSEDKATLEAALDAAKTQLETAKRQLERMESLHKDGVASEVQYDLAKSTHDAAVAAELAAEKNLEKANKGSRDEEIEMVKAKIAGLEVDLELAQNKLSDTRLVAPFSGVVSEKFFDNHETVLPGVSLLTLVDDASFEGELSVSEEFVARQGDVESIECSFDALPGKIFNASVKQTSSSVQKGNRSYLATLAIDARPEDGLLIGMVGVAKMRLRDSNNFVMIPASALIADPSQLKQEETGSYSLDSSVWTIDAATETVVRRNVKVGVFVNDKAQILEGLSGGEQIVSAGARFLTDGQKVQLAAE